MGKLLNIVASKVARRESLHSHLQSSVLSVGNFNLAFYNNFSEQRLVYMHFCMHILAIMHIMTLTVTTFQNVKHRG